MLLIWLSCGGQALGLPTARISMEWFTESNSNTYIYHFTCAAVISCMSDIPLSPNVFHVLRNPSWRFCVVFFRRFQIPLPILLAQPAQCSYLQMMHEASANIRFGFMFIFSFFLECHRTNIFCPVCLPLALVPAPSTHGPLEWFCIWQICLKMIATIARFSFLPQCLVACNVSEHPLDNFISSFIIYLMFMLRDWECCRTRHAHSITDICVSLFHCVNSLMSFVDRLAHMPWLRSHVAADLRMQPHVYTQTCIPHPRIPCLAWAWHVTRKIVDTIFLLNVEAGPLHFQAAGEFSPKSRGRSSTYPGRR